MNEVAPGIRNKGVAPKGTAIDIPPIDGSSRGSREIAGDSPVTLDWAANLGGDPPACPDNAPRFVRADAKDLGGRAVCGNAHPGTGHCVAGISCVAVVEDQELQVVAVAGDKTPARIVERGPMLSASALRAKIKRSWIEGEVTPIETDGLEVLVVGTCKDGSIG